MRVKQDRCLEDVLIRNQKNIKPAHYFYALNRKTGQKHHFLIGDKKAAEKLRVDIKWIREKPIGKNLGELIFDVPLNIITLTVDDIGKMMDKRAINEAIDSLGKGNITRRY